MVASVPSVEMSANVAVWLLKLLPAVIALLATALVASACVANQPTKV